MAGLRIGTCSWKYPSWQGLVYSRADVPGGFGADVPGGFGADVPGGFGADVPGGFGADVPGGFGTAGIDYLAEYARRYATVEVDQWFWAPPEPAAAAAYAASTPAEFRFTVKLFNELSLTHFYRKKAPRYSADLGETEPRPNSKFLSRELFDEVLAGLEPLRGKIGVLMLQFEYLNARKISGQAEFLRRLGVFVDAIPRTIPLAIETRNPGWLNERYFKFLADHGLGHAFLQGYFMPPLWSYYAKFAPLLQDPVVVRLHGPERAGIEKATGESWNRIVAPKDDELRRVIEMIGDMRGRSLTVYLNVNNHYEGSAPLTIERLRERGLVDGE